MQLKRNGPYFLPPNPPQGGFCIRCRCLPAGSPIQAISDEESEDPVNDEWVAAAVKVADDYERETTPTPHLDNDRLTPALATPSSPLSPRKLGSQSAEQDTAQFVSVPTTLHDRFGDALISIGPHMDAVLDHFHLDDALIPRLRVLTTTVRSSKWEIALRNPQWGLNYEQAFSLSNAMIADINKAHTVVQFQVRFLPSLVNLC